MNFLKSTFTGGGGGSTSRSGPGVPREEDGLTYGSTFFVLYAPDGRRWTAKCEYEHVATRKSAHYARLVKQAKHERTDLCFAKVIEENRGILNRIVDAATNRDPNDMRVCYGDKVKFGDSIILESCRYSGYSVSVQHAARGYYLRLASSFLQPTATVTFRVGWSPNKIQSSGVIPPIQTAKATGQSNDPPPPTAKQAVMQAAAPHLQNTANERYRSNPTQLLQDARTMGGYAGNNYVKTIAKTVVQGATR